MKLLRIGAGRYTVLVTEQVLSSLCDWGSAKEPKTAMLSLLTETVPRYGPQENNSNVCIVFKGTEGLAEFRKGKHRGEKFRVLWFYGDATKTVIVCARAFVKTFPATPPEEISATEDIRSQFLRAQEHKTLDIDDGTKLVRRKPR